MPHTLLYGAVDNVPQMRDICQQQMREKMKKVLERILLLKGDKSSSAFARTLSMRQQTVDNYLTGRRKLSVEFLHSICCKCGVSCDWLFGFTDERTGSSAPVSDSETAKIIAELEAEVSRLRGEVSGLRYALDSLGKSDVSLRRTAQASA